MFNAQFSMFKLGYKKCPSIWKGIDIKKGCIIFLQRQQVQQLLQRLEQQRQQLLEP